MAAGAGPVRVTDGIRQRLAELTPSERKVARTLLAGPATVGLESSARLAARAGVSGPTVSRFVQRLGFDSYPDFQQALRADLSDRVLTPVEVYRRHHEQMTGDDPVTATARMVSEAVAATVAAVSAHDVAGAVALLSEPNRPVLVTGGWFSQMLGAHLVALLREFRGAVSVVGAAPSDRAAAIADVRRRDVVVLFDYRRYELATLEFARAVHARGARIVLFTDPWLSPIAELAEATLPAEVTGAAPFETLVPTLVLVEAVVTAVAARLGDAAGARFESYGAIVDDWARPWPPVD